MNGTIYEIELVAVNPQGDETAAGVVSCAPSARLYVDGSAAAGGSGTGWSDALNRLEFALDIASADMEIWVAAGVYVPPSGSSFVLPNAAAVHGGFSGTETAVSQADPAVNVTVLSGDLDGDDAVDADGVTESVVGTNAGTIVAAGSLSASSLLQGFVVTGAAGHGLSMSNAFGAVRDCVFTGNTGTNGAAAVCSGGSPIFVACDFINNSTTTSGGAVNNICTTAEFHNSRFLGNSSNQGGALYNEDNTGNYSVSDVECRPLFVNCLFSGNHAGNCGGAMYNCEAITTIHSSTFTGNTAGYKGDSVFILNNISYPITYNTIYWDNDGYHGIGCQYVDLYGTYQSCVVQGAGVSGTDLVTTDPRLADPDGTDDVFGTEDDDVRLFTDSPAIDAANAALLPADTGDLDSDGDTSETIPIDLQGVSRTLDGGLNFGAVESTCLPPPAPITGLSADYTASGSMTLTWTNPSDPNLDHVEVWYKELDAVDYQLYTSSGNPTGTVITGLTGGLRYAFLVQVINPEGRASDPEIVTRTAIFITNITAQNSGLSSNAIYAMEAGPSGTIYVANTGLSEWDGGTGWTTWDDTNGFASSLYPCRCLEYVSGVGIYAGTNGSGLYLLDTSDTWTSWTTADGLPSDYLSSVTELSGTVYVDPNTNVGLGVYDGTSWTTKTTADGLISNSVQVVQVHPMFDWLLVGMVGGLQVYDDAGSLIETYTTGNGLPHPTVNDIAVLPGGSTLYVATYGGVASYNGSSWTTYTTANSGLLNDFVNVIEVDSNGTIYAGTNVGMSIYDGTNWTTLTTTDGLLSNSIYDFLVNADGSFYVATASGISLIDFGN